MLNPTRSSDLDTEMVAHERFSLYMKGMLPHYIGGVLNAFPFMYIIYIDVASFQDAAIWFSLNAMLATSTLVLYLAYRKFSPAFSLHFWMYMSLAPLCIYIGSLILAPWLFLHTEQKLYIYLMIVYLISLTGTTAYSLSYYLIRQTLFLTLPLLSLALTLVVLNPQNLWLYFIVILFLWGSSFAFSLTVNKFLLNGIALKFENVQARLLAERANSEKSKFIATASHDIRQPLQAVHFFMDGLKNKHEELKGSVLFERMEKSTESMSELLDNLLDVSKLDSQEILPEPIHLRLKPMIEKLIDEISPQAEQKSLKCNLSCDDVICVADPILLRQVLNNLVSNAIRYTTRGAIFVSAFEQKNKIFIRIQDTGIGIPENKHQTVFHEFVQLQNVEREAKKGLGLGLAIVKKLCDLQGWSVSLESKEGIGSIFTIGLPTGNEASIPNVKPVVDTISQLRLNIILIDDDKDIRDGLYTLLLSWGAEVHAFENVHEAVRYIESSSTSQIDLIISDFRLAKNETGVEAIAAIRDKANYDIDGMIITGDTELDRAQTFAMSQLKVLHKPISPAKLRVAISQVKS